MTTTATRSEDRLLGAWATPPGLPGWLSAVNHKQIGARFVVTALAFLLVGGVQALLLRLQLSSADADVLGPQAYNETFTMHGTTMMFLFAVPVLEGLGMYLVPLMVGARDLPFPRLNAFGYWAYLLGGVILYWSFATGSVPDGGWFAYTPLTGPEHSPGSSLDYWLLGVTFVEVSGIVGALELVVVILRHRAPGMSLDRVPLFVWSVLVMSVMILFAFPAVLTASSLLEVERKFGAPFYDPGAGGNPLLWQHLFWIFGHPEVYIMLLPATGIVSTVVPVFARRSIVGYPFLVASLVAIAVLSFGLWVHHMFTVGLPALVLAFFAVSSVLIAIPSGVQVFAWLATLWHGRPRWDTPLLFVAGFVFIFVLGGITGVMVAAAPFDWQAHDSFFVVAHFHYVLIGGMVFPVFAGLHHWFPKMTGRQPGERAGTVAFWLMFVGFNVAFFPQHLLGLWGMPRRYYTYPRDVGWDGLNLLSTWGAFALALGVLVFFANLAWARAAGPAAASDPWGADTLEWAVPSPPPPYNFQTPPLVSHREPLWHPTPAGTDPDTEAVLLRLARPPGGVREQPVTGAVDARLLGVARLAAASYWPLVAAVALAAALVGVLLDSAVVTGAGGAAGVAALVGWLRPEPGGGEGDGADGDGGAERGELDADPATPAPAAPASGAGTPRAGSDVVAARPSSVWGAVAGVAVLGTILAYLLYAYFYLAVTAERWPPAGTPAPPLLGPFVLAGALVLTTPAAAVAWRVSGRGRAEAGALAAVALAGVAAVAGGAWVLRELAADTTQAYGAIVVTIHVFHGAVTAVGAAVAAFVAYQSLRVPDHPWVPAGAAVAAVWWWYAVAGWLAVAAVVYAAPHVS